MANQCSPQVNFMVQLLLIQEEKEEICHKKIKPEFPVQHHTQMRTSIQLPAQKSMGACAESHHYMTRGWEVNIM